MINPNCELGVGTCVRTCMVWRRRMVALHPRDTERGQHCELSGGYAEGGDMVCAYFCTLCKPFGRLTRRPEPKLGPMNFQVGREKERKKERGERLIAVSWGSEICSRCDVPSSLGLQ